MARLTTPAVHAASRPPRPVPAAEPSPSAQAMTLAATPSTWPQRAGHGKLGKHTTRASLRIDHGQGNAASNTRQQATPPRRRPQNRHQAL
ncbi:hypothetical protein AAKU55_004800 [Oxalobacteraceae bacterium GrIS 1.11]